MKFEEVDIAIEKPEYRGCFNITAECLPRACGRVWFDGQHFLFRDSSIIDSDDLLNDSKKIYWLRGIND